jgi:hypothetical protein
MKVYGKKEAQLHAFLTWALDGGHCVLGPTLPTASALRRLIFY